MKVDNKDNIIMSEEDFEKTLKEQIEDIKNILNYQDKKGENKENNSVEER